MESTEMDRLFADITALETYDQGQRKGEETPYQPSPLFDLPENELLAMYQDTTESVKVTGGSSVMAKSALEKWFDEFLGDAKFVRNDQNQEPTLEQRQAHLHRQHVEPHYEQYLRSAVLLDFCNKEIHELIPSLNFNSQNSTVSALPGFPWFAEGDHVASPTAVMAVKPLVSQPLVVPHIQNVLSSVHLGCKLDLEVIARNIWNVEYKKDSCALLMRIRNPRATARVYKSGKMVCLGAKSVKNSYQAAVKFSRKLQKLNYPISFTNFKIHNILATCTTAPTNLNLLSQQHWNRCIYVTEVGGPLHYKVTPTVTASIFASGNVSLAGSKTEDEVREACRILSDILQPFRKL